MNREELLKNAKPILFNTEMVQAILEGQKTVTRRVLKHQPIYEKNSAYMGGGVYRFEHYGFDLSKSWRGLNLYKDEGKNIPFEVGDIIWVRETWYYENHMHDLTAGEPDLLNGEYSHRYVYRASSPDYPVNIGVGKHGWKPSIHMPKVAARIFLKVTDVRAERLQDIRCDCEVNEVALEGVSIDADEVTYIDLKDQFKGLWDSTIKKQDLDKYSWNANPWVWVIEFERVEDK